MRLVSFTITIIRSLTRSQLGEEWLLGLFWLRVRGNVVNCAGECMIVGSGVCWHRLNKQSEQEMRQGYESSKHDTSWPFFQKGSSLKKAPSLPNSTTTWGPRVQNCELWRTFRIQTTKYTLFSFFYQKIASNSPLIWWFFVTGYKVSIL